jgi:transcriptional regulator with XRE-family HTH domain
LEDHLGAEILGGKKVWFVREKHSDLRAGRLLVRLTCGELARLCQMPETMISDAERNLGGEITQGTIQRVLEAAGVEFGRPGIVRHIDGRIAPTKRAVGVMRGDRLRRGMNALGMSRLELASRARLADGTIAKLQGEGRVKLSASVYAVVGALQLAGYRFLPDGKDKALVPRKKRRELASDQDLPIEWLGAGIFAPDLDKDA